MIKNLLKILQLILVFIVVCPEMQGQINSNKRTNDTLENRVLSEINGSIGIITTTNKYQFGDSIFVFNEQKQPFTSIVITYEYQILALKCLMNTKDFYKVQISDSVSGYLLKINPLIKYQTWEEHVLSVFSVGFNEKTNPIRIKPNNTASLVNYVSGEFYLPYKIQGDWLQVRWGSDKDWEYGWIIWEKNGTLIIELFYFA